MKTFDPKTGMRLTDCCGAASTFMDTLLCCKKCHKEVEIGEGDGTEWSRGIVNALTPRSKPLPPPPPTRLKPTSKDARTARLLLAIKEVEKVECVVEDIDDKEHLQKALKLLRGLL